MNVSKVVEKADAARYGSKLPIARLRTDITLAMQYVVLDVSLLGGEVEVLVVLALS